MSHYDHVGALPLQTMLPVTKTPLISTPVSPIKRKPSPIRPFFPLPTSTATPPPPSVSQDIMDALLVIGVAVPEGADPTSPATLLLMVHAFQRMAGMQEGPLDEGTTAAIKAAAAKFAGDVKLPETEEEKRKKQQMVIAGVIAVGVIGFILMRRK
jgi:hypothetical protein